MSQCWLLKGGVCGSQTRVTPASSPLLGCRVGTDTRVQCSGIHQPCTGCMRSNLTALKGSCMWLEMPFPGRQRDWGQDMLRICLGEAKFSSYQRDLDVSHDITVVSKVPEGDDLSPSRVILILHICSPITTLLPLFRDPT